MAKKSKKSLGRIKTGRDGAAVTLLSLSNIAKEESSTAEGLDGVGSSAPRDDSDACNPSEDPDLCIPPLKKKKKKKKKRKSSDTELSDEEKEEKKKKKLESSSDAANAGSSGEEIVEKKKKKRETFSDTADAGPNVELKKKKKKKQESGTDKTDAVPDGEEKKKKKKRRKNRCDIIDAGLNGEEEEKLKLTSSSDRVDEWLSSLEEMEKKKRMNFSDTVDRGLDGEDTLEKNKTKKKKGNGGMNNRKLKNASGVGSNGRIVTDDGEVKQDVSSGLSEGSGGVLKKKRSRDRASDDSGWDVDAYRNPAGIIGSNEGIVEIDGAVGESRRKKTVRFHEPSDSAAHEIVTYMPRENIEDDIEYFSEDRNWKKDIVRPGLLYGKYTKEEDEKIKTSVFNYIKMRGWGDEGLQIVLHSSQHKAIARGCWLEIAKCLPARPVKQIHSRAARLLGSHKRGKWSAEELEVLTNLQKAHGNNWIKISSHMDRSAAICKDRWRHLKLLPTRKSGPWQQDELDKLCKFVRRSLRIKASIVPTSKTLDRREIRDDISWEYISEQMQRDSSVCAEVWYHKLASPMISAKKWANGDDRLLLQRLMELGGASEEALDWDAILDHREGELCAQRWMEMTKLLGKSDHVSFEDKLELLAKRYAPDLVGIEEES